MENLKQKLLRFALKNWDELDLIFKDSSIQKAL
jgi:hypothetical protein